MVHARLAVYWPNRLQALAVKRPLTPSAERSGADRHTVWTLLTHLSLTIVLELNDALIRGGGAQLHLTFTTEPRVSQSLRPTATNFGHQQTQSCQIHHRSYTTSAQFNQILSDNLKLLQLRSPHSLLTCRALNQSLPRIRWNTEHLCRAHKIHCPPLAWRLLYFYQ